jgi:acetyltransferase-like isoleucine patch superfamily enzyme
MPGATIAGQVLIEDEAAIGTNATILPRLRIGKRAVIGAGAVVTHDVPEGVTVVGVPARQVASRRKEQLDRQDPWLCQAETEKL